MPNTMLQVEPLTPSIGATVHGVDLTKGLSPTLIEDLQQLWLQHLILFFRDQELTCEQLQALAACFGELHIHPQGDSADFPGLIPVHADQDSIYHIGRTWHADVTCDERPPLGSILHLHEVPPSGGDTLFANMYAAYEALSSPLQEFLLGLQAFHSGQPNIEGYFGMSADQLRDKRFPEAVHPLVCVHPVTKRPALYVNEIFTTHIVDLSAQESRALLDFLFTHLSQPKFQCRFHWRKNSVAMWDNRCAQHMALWDYYPQTRSGYRATIAGDRPAGSDKHRKHDAA